jgi:hypothetical protein
MFRALAFVSLLAVVAIGGYVYTQSAPEPAGSTPGTAVEHAAAGAAADANLLTARTAVEAFFAAGGTYVGASAPAGVTLVAADASTYCLQSDSGATARHLAGPGGSPAAGPC